MLIACSHLDRDLLKCDRHCDKDDRLVKAIAHPRRTGAISVACGVEEDSYIDSRVFAGSVKSCLCYVGSGFFNTKQSTMHSQTMNAVGKTFFLRNNSEFPDMVPTILGRQNRSTLKTLILNLLTGYLRRHLRLQGCNCSLDFLCFGVSWFLCEKHTQF